MAEFIGIRRLTAPISTFIQRFEERILSRISNPNKQEWAKYGLRFGYVLVGLAIVIGIFDVLIMPMYVGRGRDTKVPNVTSMSFSQATKMLEEQGLSLKITNEYYNNAVPAGYIVSQLPFPSAIVKPGRTVYIVLSKGKQMIEMPQLQGMTVRDARIALMRLGLNLNNAAYTFNSSIPANVIFAQTVSAHKKVAFGTSVDVTVSLGAEVVYAVVPDVVGRTLDEAKALLTGAGFMLGEITTGERNETFLPNTVIAQIPAGRDSVKAGTPISLTVSR